MTKPCTKEWLSVFGSPRSTRLVRCVLCLRALRLLLRTSALEGLPKFSCEASATGCNPTQCDAIARPNLPPKVFRSVFSQTDPCLKGEVV